MLGKFSAFGIGLAMSIVTSSAHGQSAGSAARGLEIVNQWCVECHAAGDERTSTDNVPTFSYVMQLRSADYVRGFLANPHVRLDMPPIELSNPDIDDLIAYLLTLK